MKSDEPLRKKNAARCIAVSGKLTPYPEGYGRRLWGEVLMPELRQSAYAEKARSRPADADAEQHA